MKFGLVRSFSLVVVVLCARGSSDTRILTIGSNPYASWESFPQDILLREGNFIYYRPGYGSGPWWGDLDEPERKPNTSTDYTITGVDLKEQDAYFKHRAAVHSVANQFGYAHRFGNDLTARAELDYTLDAFSNRAEGRFTHEEDGYSGHIPFDYSVFQALSRVDINAMAASTLWSMPMGARLEAGFENAGGLSSEFDVTKYDTISITSDRLVWGWAEPGCNHIFGPRGTEGDAWFQNEYGRGPLYRVALRAGATLPRIKLGTNLSMKLGRQDLYRWQADTSVAPEAGDTLFYERFVGSYEKSRWSRQRRTTSLSAYGNLTWREQERYALNTFGSLTWSSALSRNVLASDPEVERNGKERRRGVLLECIPNASIRLGERLNYIDVGLVSRYGYDRYGNRYNYSVGGGAEETYRNSSVVVDDEVSWENFSYANKNHFDAGADAGMMFPLVGDDTRFLGLGLGLLGLSRWTIETKYYGQNSDNGSNVSFSVRNRRRNFRREFWFNTLLTLRYMTGPFHLQLEVTEPLLYSIRSRTRVTDGGGDRLLYEHEKAPLWISQEGMRIGLYGSYAFTLPFLR